MTTDDEPLELGNVTEGIKQFGHSTPDNPGFNVRRTNGLRLLSTSVWSDRASALACA
jgi:hypothetical protein